MGVISSYDKITHAKQIRFLGLLAWSGCVTVAARKADVSRRVVYHWRQHEPWFAERWEGALQQAADAVEIEMRRRAISGTEKPVFYKGHKVGEITEYSDGLLAKLAEGLRPEKFRKRADVSLHATTINAAVMLSDQQLETIASREGAGAGCLLQATTVDPGASGTPGGGGGGSAGGAESVKGTGASPQNLKKLNPPKSS